MITMALQGWKESEKFVAAASKQTKAAVILEDNACG